MLYLARIPSARLAPFVESMWYFASASASVLESVVPDGTMQLLVNLDADRLRWYTGAGYAAARSVEGAALSGCQPTHFAIDVGEQRKMVGVKFKPGGAAPFLKVPAHELCALHVPLADLWAGGSEVREQLLEHSTRWRPPGGVSSREPGQLIPEPPCFLLAVTASGSRRKKSHGGHPVPQYRYPRCSGSCYF